MASATVTLQINILKRWYQMLEFLPKRWQYIRGKATFPITGVRTLNLRTSYPRKTEPRVSNDTFSLTGLHVLENTSCILLLLRILGFVSGNKSGRDVTLTINTHVEPRQKKYSYTSTPHLGLHEVFYDELYV